MVESSRVEGLQVEYGERPPLVLIVSRIHQVMGELASLRADGLYDRPPFFFISICLSASMSTGCFG